MVIQFETEYKRRLLTGHSTKVRGGVYPGEGSTSGSWQGQRKKGADDGVRVGDGNTLNTVRYEKFYKRPHINTQKSPPPYDILIEG